MKEKAGIKGKRICCIFTDSLYEEMKIRSKANGVSIGWMIRQACIAYLKLNGDGREFFNPRRGERTDLIEAVFAEGDRRIAKLKRLEQRKSK